MMAMVSLQIWHRWRYLKLAPDAKSPAAIAKMLWYGRGVSRDGERAISVLLQAKTNLKRNVTLQSLFSLATLTLEISEAENGSPVVQFALACMVGHSADGAVRSMFAQRRRVPWFAFPKGDHMSTREALARGDGRGGQAV
jgi:hypothetical protein